MKRRFVITIFCILPAAAQLLYGDDRGRWIAGAGLAVFALSVVAERWAAYHPQSPLTRTLFRGRVISLAKAALLAVTFLGLYLLVITFAIRFNRLDDPVILTISFFAVFLGLMAFVGAILLGLQQLRNRFRERSSVRQVE